MGASPDVLAHLRFAHQAAGMRHQIAQQRQGLGPQGDGLFSLPQATLRVIQMERPKPAVLLRRHRFPPAAQREQAFKHFDGTAALYLNTSTVFMNGGPIVTSLCEECMKHVMPSLTS